MTVLTKEEPGPSGNEFKIHIFKNDPLSEVKFD